jgi:hypothetical protein
MADNIGYEQNPEAGQSQEVDRQTQNPPAECSRCGGLPTIAMQATCVAKTKWGHTNANPVDPAIVSVVKVAKPETVVGEQKLWHIGLCNPCQIKGFVDHLQSTIRGNRKFLTWAPVVLVISLGVLALFIFTSTNPEGPLTLVVTLFFLAAVVCIIGIPISAIELSGNLRQLKLTNSMTSVPQKKIIESFDGEANRILESLEKGRTDIFGSFSLPEFSTETRPGLTKGISFREVTVIKP